MAFKKTARVAWRVGEPLLLTTAPKGKQSSGHRFTPKPSNESVISGTQAERVCSQRLNQRLPLRTDSPTSHLRSKAQPYEVEAL